MPRHLVSRAAVVFVIPPRQAALTTPTDSGYEETELALLVSELKSLVQQAATNPHCASTMQKFAQAEWMYASKLSPLEDKWLPVITQAAFRQGGR